MYSTLGRSLYALRISIPVIVKLKLFKSALILKYVYLVSVPPHPPDKNKQFKK